MSNLAAVTLETETTEPSHENAAWASVNTPLEVEELIAFCQEDIERLFRINPYLEFTDWRNVGDDTYFFSGANSSQESPFTFELNLEVEKLPDGLLVHYPDGLKESTRFRVEPSPYGSNLTILENYRSLPEGERDERILEVDRSLTTWAGDIQKFLATWKQWRWLTPWRWYMNRVWKRMKPSGRRIAYMFWWITLIEIALIALGVGIYWSEYT